MSTRPSELVGLDPNPRHGDAYTAYCLDEAVWLWGSYVEGELDQVRDKAKTAKQAAEKVKMRFRTLMADREPEVEAAAEVDPDFPKHLPRLPAPTKFRDPMSLMKKTKAEV